MSRWWKARRLVVPVLVASCTAVGACTAPPVRPLPDNPRVPELGPPPCAWQWVATWQDTNAAYPDTNATYWYFGYHLPAGGELRVKGTFPPARYSSLAAYDALGRQVGQGLADQEMTGFPNGQFAVTVTTRFIEANSADVMAAGAPEKDAIGSLFYRIYMPDPGVEPRNIALPTIEYIAPDRSTTPVPLCGDIRANPDAAATVSDITPEPWLDQDRPWFWKASVGTGLFPNPDNAYLGALIKPQEGRVVVVTGKAPTYPDTRHGAPLTKDGTQLRYWSMCSNGYVEPYPVYACLADDEIAPGGGGGRYTIVVATEKDKPSEQWLRDNGAVWLPWGDATGGQTNALLLRNMLPAPDFNQAVQNVDEWQRPLPVMGDYYPKARDCALDALYGPEGLASCPDPVPDLPSPG